VIEISVNFVNEEQKKSDQAEASEKSILESIQSTLVEDVCVSLLLYLIVTISIILLL
jgi:hypothetical protein